MKEEIMSFLYEGGFSAINIDNYDFETSIGSFIVKNNKVYLAGDKVTFKFFNNSLVPFIDKNKNKWFLKGKARRQALTLKAQLSYPNAILLDSISTIELFFNKDPKRYIVMYKGEVILITKSKKEAIEMINKYYSYEFKEEPKVVKTVYLNEGDNIYQGVEDFQSREEELTEALNVVLSMKNRQLLADEIELLKELQSEIANLIGDIDCPCNEDN